MQGNEDAAKMEGGTCDRVGCPPSHVTLRRQIPMFVHSFHHYSYRRDCQGFQNPPRVRGRVSGGMGMGWDFHTHAKPLPLAGVKGIYTKIFAYVTFIYLQKVFFSLKTLFLACKNLYYKESECY